MKEALWALSFFAMKKTLWALLFFAMFLGAVVYGDHAFTRPCPNDYEIGGVVTHITGNFRGIIEECRSKVTIVDIGNGNTVIWKNHEVQEYEE